MPLQPGILLCKGVVGAALSQSLAANLAVLDKMFGTSADYYAKEITIYHCRGSILLFDGMASLDSLWELLLDAASRQAPPQQAGQRCTGPQVFELILHGSAFPAESEPVTDLADLIKRMTAGWRSYCWTAAQRALPSRCRD